MVPFLFSKKISIMKVKLFLTLISLIFVQVSFAQYQSYVDGAPATLIKKVDVEGSEFLYEKWLPATVKNTKGDEFKNVMVKYNLLEDVPYFLGKADQAMSFATPLTEFTVQKENGELQKFMAGLPALDKYNEFTFYEVLVDGKTKLLKKTAKKITESRAYNSATTVKNIVDNTNYFVFEDGNLSMIKKDKKFLMAALSRKEDIQKYLSNKEVSIKKEEDLIKALEKYNSL